MEQDRKQRVVAVELMDEATRTVIARRVVKNWSRARKIGVGMLKAEADEKLYIRFYDVNDASDVDFLTRDRMKKSTGLAVREGKELKPRGRRKTDHTGKPTREYQQYDANYKCKRGRVI